MDEGVRMHGRSLEAPPGPPPRKLLLISVTLPSPIPPNPTSYKLLCASTNPPAGTGNHAGVRLDETVHPSSEKSRLDAWVSSHIGGVSHARIQYNIRSSLATVNGRISWSQIESPRSRGGILIRVFSLAKWFHLR